MNESDYADYPVDAAERQEDVEPEASVTPATRTWVVSRAGIAEARRDGGQSRTEGRDPAARA